MHDTVWREPLDTSAPREKKLKIKRVKEQVNGVEEKKLNGARSCRSKIFERDRKERSFLKFKRTSFDANFD